MRIGRMKPVEALAGMAIAARVGISIPIPGTPDLENPVMKAATQTSTIPRAFTLAGLPQRSGQGQGYCRDTERGGNEENDMHAIDEDFRAIRHEAAHPPP